MIIQIEKDNFKILNCMGKVVNVNRSEILQRKNKSNAVALDCEQNPVGVRVNVKVVTGPMAGHEGEVKNIYRYFVFIKSNAYPENGGIMVTRAKNIKIFTNTVVIMFLHIFFKDFMLSRIK